MNELTLYATDPAGMVLAQNNLMQWCEDKLQSVGQELKEAEYLIERVRHAHLSVKPVERQIAMAKKRLSFYEKIKAALALGYYIIPPLDVQLFAVRTKKDNPTPDTSTRRWQNDEKVRSLPVGVGQYVNPDPIRELIDTRVTTDAQGKTTQVAIYENTEFRDLEFPFLPVKPQIIEETGKALAAKVFDMLGVAPQYRKADPMVVGQIKHWKQGRQPVTFFVAWWLNTEDL